MSNPVKTIAFNTGRQYTAAGQMIVATLHDDNIVTFMDHARHIDGAFELPEHGRFTAQAVANHYDSMMYQSSARSMHEGMATSGANRLSNDLFRQLRDAVRMSAVTVWEAPVAAKPAQTVRLEDHKLMGLTIEQLEAQWAAMCEEYGWTQPTSVQERLERIKRLGMAPGYATAWMMKFIEAWDAATAANLAAFADKYGADDDEDEEQPEMWLVIASSGLKSIVLYESESQRDCIAFARGYTAHGDFGGWSVIAVTDGASNAVFELDAPEGVDDDLVLEGEAA